MHHIFSCLLLSLSVTAAFTTPVFAEAKQQKVSLIPRKVIFGNAEKASPKLSPNGAKLAYLAPDKNGVMNVWVQNIGDDKSAELITSDKKRGISSFFWRYDGKHIIYGQDKDGDENGHLYETNIKTKATRDLTPFDGVKAGIVAYEREFPNEMLIQLNRRDKTVFDVYKLNLKDGSIKLEAQNDTNAYHWLADHTLTVRGQQSYDTDGSTIISVRDSKNAPWRTFLHIGPEDEASLLDFSLDGKSLYIVSSVGANTERLVKVNLADGSQKVIFEDPRYDVTDVIQNPKTYEIEAVGVERERFEWIVLDPKRKADFAYLQKKKGVFDIISSDHSDQHWIVGYSFDNESSQYYLYDTEKKQSKFLFSSRPKLNEYQLSNMTPISFQAKDGMQLYGYLTLPVGKEPKNLPTVLYVHGGPWVRDHWGFHPLIQWLANRGYAVLQVNYRGSAGYGKDYLNAGNKEWGAKMHTDLLDGKKWMIDQGYANPEKVAIFGGSYGGYATLVGLAFTPDEFCCGVSIVGVSNLITHLQSSPPYWAVFNALTDLRIGSLETEKDFLISRSPLFKADKITSPLLIGHGANDPRVKQAESDQIVAAMRKNGKEVEYLLFPDEGHGFARPENKMKFYAAAELFLSKHLGGRVQPPTPEEDWSDVKR
jgi:dipeptidyl aminopeptidase/acylaminoacyl peptidase